MTARFPPLPEADLDADQRRMAARAAPTGPYQAFLRAPLLWERLQPLRQYLATQSVLAPGEREVAILVLARHLGSSGAFEGHRALALAAGIAGDAIDAISDGAEIADVPLAPAEALAADVVDRLLRQHRLSDDLFARAARQWGERGVIELIGLTGFFTTISLTLNVAEIAASAPLRRDQDPYSPADKN
jgi:4-carboxymuconolactone decarboxylase